MQLLTKEIERKIKPIGTFENTAPQNIPITVKFFTPDSGWTWYVTEGEKRDNDDWLFFGLVDGTEKELGYFLLSDLTDVRGSLGLPIERDRGFNAMLSEV
jgi:hypothetical protein